MAIRSRIGAGSGDHSSAASASWRVNAAAAAASGCSKTENVLSPSPRGFTRLPPWAATISRTMASCRIRASAIAAGAASQSRLEPAMSVSRNVTTAGGAVTPRTVRLPAPAEEGNLAQGVARWSSTV